MKVKVKVKVKVRVRVRVRMRVRVRVRVRVCGVMNLRARLFFFLISKKESHTYRIISEQRG